MTTQMCRSYITALESLNQYLEHAYLFAEKDKNIEIATVTKLKIENNKLNIIRLENKLLDIRDRLN